MHVRDYSGPNDIAFNHYILIPVEGHHWRASNVADENGLSLFIDEL